MIFEQWFLGNINTPAAHGGSVWQCVSVIVKEQKTAGVVTMQYMKKKKLAKEIVVKKDKIWKGIWKRLHVDTEREKKTDYTDNDREQRVRV